MFGRLLWKLLRSNRGRLAVALVAVISGAAVISALLTVELDVSRKLTQEFRLLGPNIVVSGKNADQSVDFGGLGVPSANAAPPAFGLSNSAAGLESATIAAAAPFFFSVTRVSGTPVVTAGTWLDQLAKLNPTWRMQGNWIASRDDASLSLIGRKAARQFAVAPGDSIVLDYDGSQTMLHVAGVIDSGAADDNQIFVSLPVAWKLTRQPDFVTLWQLNVTGSGTTIADYAAHLAAAFPQYEVRPVRAVTDAEGNLLGRTRLLILSMIVLILALTALCVLATMAALATERRADVGLMKALGGTIARIVGLFLAELGVLGAAGGAIGCVAGVVLAQWIGRRVFGASIEPRWEIFPLTIVLMVVVAMAGALPLQRLGNVEPAVILRGE
ncbi:MAG: FtsX-like permease family protein [Candidatus Acidiferrales bacterium]